MIRDVDLERVLQSKKAALFDELMALDAERQRLAREAILRAVQIIVGFPVAAHAQPTR